MATIRIQTTQNVSLEYEVASVGDRVLATLIDLLVVAAWGGLWTFFFSKMADGSKADSTPVDYHDPAQAVGYAIAILLLALGYGPLLCYSLVCEIFFNGQTLGKKARNIRVVRLDGTPARLSDYLLRWLLRFVDIWLSWGLAAVLTIVLTRKGQRLGDLAAGSTVVMLKARSRLLPDLAAPLAPASYQPVFPQAAQLSDHDLALLRQLLSHALHQQNHQLLHSSATKIKTLLNLQSNLKDEDFLRTILRDHAHLLMMEG
ncbi:MAG: RDD family protein [Janthinobacterium lividum]